MGDYTPALEYFLPKIMRVVVASSGCRERLQLPRREGAIAEFCALRDRQKRDFYSVAKTCCCVLAQWTAWKYGEGPRVHERRVRRVMLISSHRKFAGWPKI